MFVAWWRRTATSSVGVLCCVLAGLVSTPPNACAEAAYRDDAVKAAFLFRFTGYVDWPEATLESGKFTVAVLGSPGVAAELSRLFTRYAVKDLPAKVRAVESAAQAADAQMVYVGAGYEGNLRDLTQYLSDRPVLVVTDRPNGLDDGSAVNFLLVDRRVRFEVSLPAANRAGLRMSSQLLSVAARVRGAQFLRPGQLCIPAYGPIAEQVCLVRVASL